jgi:hypothetical protein
VQDFNKWGECDCIEVLQRLTLILLTWRIRRAPNNASKWQVGFNSAFKGLTRAAPIPSYIPWDGFMLTDECTKYSNRESNSLRQTVTTIEKEVLKYQILWKSI